MLPTLQESFRTKAGFDVGCRLPPAGSTLSATAARFLGRFGKLDERRSVRVGA